VFRLQKAEALWGYLPQSWFSRTNKAKDTNTRKLQTAIEIHFGSGNLLEQDPNTVFSGAKYCDFSIVMPAGS